MAVTKEAIALVLDVGKSMQAELDVGKSVHGDKDCKTVLDSAKCCINMIIQRKIFSESKDEIALIVFGSTDTSNNLAQSNSSEYKNIKVVQDLLPANWELLEYVNEIRGTDISTDFIRDSALLTAINLLQNTISGKKFFSRRILFLSCFDGYFCSDRVNRICEELKMHKIDLNIIGPVAFPVEDVSNGNCIQPYQNEGLISSKAECHICKILREVNGESYSFSEALPALIYYQKKKVHPIPWNANLDIGTNLNIPISAYIKVNECKQKSWKNAYAHKLNAKLDRGVTFLMNDELQTKVSKDGIIPAFKYGTTLVPYSEEDKINMDYQSGEKGMKVLGFTKAENVQRYHCIGDKSMYIFGQKNRELGGVILAPFIQALYDTKMVAIVRYVYSQKSPPKIGFLSPRIKESYECLVFVALPFMEDLRHYVFTPFDSDSRNMPTEEQLEAVDSLITAMDLTSALNSEDVSEGEILKPKSTVNPYLQRLYQCLQYRTFHPEKPLPEILPHIKALINPSSKVLKRAELSLKRVKSAFPVKETVPKKVSEKRTCAYPNGKSDESLKRHQGNEDFESEAKVNIIDSVSDKIIKVGSMNPVKDFQYLVNNQSLPFHDICQQMMDVVFKYLQDSGSVKLYHSKIISICKELRRASLKESESAKYNSFMTRLQNVLLECDEELWDKIKNEKVGLISTKELSSSTVSLMQAEAFFSISSIQDNKDSIKGADSYGAEEDDYDNLLEQL